MAQGDSGDMADATTGVEQGASGQRVDGAWEANGQGDGGAEGTSGEQVNGGQMWPHVCMGSK